MITFKQFLAEIEWKYGSGQFPKTYFDSSPFPSYPALTKLRKTKYQWEDKSRLVLVPVRELYSWQSGVDSTNLRPLIDPNYPAIKVNQIEGKLVIMNGNHRAIAAYISGLKYIKADYVNFDQLKAARYWTNKLECRDLPEHRGITSYSNTKIFIK